MISGIALTKRKRIRSMRTISAVSYDNRNKLANRIPAVAIRLLQTTSLKSLYLPLVDEKMSSLQTYSCSRITRYSTLFAVERCRKANVS
jgi:hypothetical protein